MEDLEHVRFTDDVAPVARVSIAQVCFEPRGVKCHLPIYCNPALLLKLTVGTS